MKKGNEKYENTVKINIWYTKLNGE